MKRLKHYFIGDYLAKTEDVFERAKIELLYSYCMAFFFLGTLFYIHIIYLHLWLHVWVVSIAVISLGAIPFILKYAQNVRLAAVFYVVQQILVSLGNIILEKGRADAATGFWVSLFILFAFFLFNRKWGMIFLIIMGVCSGLAARISENITTDETGALASIPDATILPFVLIIIVIWMFIKTRNDAEKYVAEQKAMLEHQNKEVTDSINYAQRIQKAILPSHRLIESYLPKSLVVYLPKDIVSGDFYWVEKKGNKVFFAVADCTGHGVPGAMMSVIGQNALNRVINEFGITRPSEILDKLSQLVEESFSKSGSDVRDGMDICLCALDITLKKLEYAGANNAVYIISKDALKELKANKQPIGRFESRIPFNNHELDLNEGDMVYLFSDGIADQFGGPEGKKYKYKRVKELLLQNYNKSHSEQKNIIITEFVRWKGKNEQIDDVCLMGVKI
jgi:serine phosphatase RsbU (regulator of sigma subunit)